MMKETLQIEGTDLNLFYEKNSTGLRVARDAETEVIKRYNSSKNRITRNPVNLYLVNDIRTISTFEHLEKEIEGLGIATAYNFDPNSEIALVISDREFEIHGYDKSWFIANLATNHAQSMTMTHHDKKIRNIILGTYMPGPISKVLVDFIYDSRLRFGYSIQTTVRGVLADELAVKSGFEREYFSSWEKSFEKGLADTVRYIELAKYLEEVLLRNEKIDEKSKEKISNINNITQSYEVLVGNSRPIAVAKRTNGELGRTKKMHEEELRNLHPEVARRHEEVKDILVRHNSSSIQNIVGTISNLMEIFMEILYRNNFNGFYDIELSS